MRKLTAKDLYVVGKMLKRALPELSKIDMSSGDQKAIGQKVIGILLDTCYDDIWAWLADLAGMGVDEFNGQPVDFPASVIEHLVNSEDIHGFFARVSALMK